METHPIPIPSTRAASHRVWTAPTAEYSLIWGHRLAPQAVVSGGVPVGKIGEMAGRVIEPSELQPSVLRGTVRFLSRERLCVTGFEITPDCGTTQRIINKDKPPRLAQPHRWRETNQFDDQDALRLLIEPGLQMDAVGPAID